MRLDRYALCRFTDYASDPIGHWPSIVDRELLSLSLRGLGRHDETREVRLHPVHDDTDAGLKQPIHQVAEVVGRAEA